MSLSNAIVPATAAGASSPDSYRRCEGETTFSGGFKMCRSTRARKKAQKGSQSLTKPHKASQRLIFRFSFFEKLKMCRWHFSAPKVVPALKKRRLCRACLRVGFGLGPFQDDLWDNGGLLCVGFTARVESPIGGPCEARSQSQHGASNNQKATLAVIPRGRGWTRFALRVKTNAGRAWRPSLPQILWGKWGYAPVCSRPVCVFPRRGSLVRAR